MRHILLFAVALLTLLPAAPAAAQTTRRCFSETGFCIEGAFRAYWERNGGLPIFGYPIGPVQVEEIRDEQGKLLFTGPVQWFERSRLEDHSGAGLGILAGRLGAEQLRDFTFQPLLTLPPAVDPPADPGCRYFPQTRHSLCPPYLQVWERSGGLTRMGYPISEPFLMTMGPWSGEVQYFERQRMERHDELPGAPVLLGLLGREQRLRIPSATCAVGMDPVFGDRAWQGYGLAMYLAGCPAVAQRDIPLAEQYFERGVMVWSGWRFDTRVYAIRTTPLPVIWTSYPDRWSEGQPESGNLQPPPGLQEPKRGFGKVWREAPGVRETLGWATTAERADVGVVQPYQKGAAIYMQGANTVYLFGPNGQTWAFPRYP
ncbi:MAG: hypothetical protein RMK84_14290 [Oscillochloridaceae bacterium]|nr:hypothetical protein [Chloroflexaceae bacterium]MDW8391291.1 hypothetical protein [Oscillochloridaceae bacterium]